MAGVSWVELALRTGISKASLEKYACERIKISYDAFKKLCALVSFDSKKVLTALNCRVVKWSTAENLANVNHFGKSRTKLVLPRITFEKTSLDLDLSKAEFGSTDLKRGVILPNKITPLLAEEVGMHLGDGFMSNYRPDYRLRGGKDEKDFYDGFVKQTFKTLFNIDVNVKEFAESYGFECYSQALWSFKHDVLGIQLSPKTDIRIPEIFKVNDQAILCGLIRGYFDTDGSLVAYSRYGHDHYYPMIAVASASKPLILDVLEILRMLGFSCCYSENFGKWISFHIQLYGYANFQRYCDLIGWNNPKYVWKAGLLKEKFKILGVAQIV